MSDEPIPRWQKLAALTVWILAAACLLAFRRRLHADLWPLDSSRIGPNLIASAITWAMLFGLAVLLWPPTRRRLHRFANRKLAPLHASHAAIHVELQHLRASHKRMAESHDRLHRKLDALAPKPQPARKPTDRPKQP